LKRKTVKAGALHYPNIVLEEKNGKSRSSALPENRPGREKRKKQELCITRKPSWKRKTEKAGALHCPKIVLEEKNGKSRSSALPEHHPGKEKRKKQELCITRKPSWKRKTVKAGALHYPNMAQEVEYSN
jgi:hypothetical protein